MWEQYKVYIPFEKSYTLFDRPRCLLIEISCIFLKQSDVFFDYTKILIGDVERSKCRIKTKNWKK